MPISVCILIGELGSRIKCYYFWHFRAYLCYYLSRFLPLNGLNSFPGPFYLLTDEKNHAFNSLLKNHNLYSYNDYLSSFHLWFSLKYIEFIRITPLSKSKNFSIVLLVPTFIISLLTCMSFWMSFKLYFKLLVNTDMDVSLILLKQLNIPSSIPFTNPPSQHIYVLAEAVFSSATGCPWMVKFLSSYIVENVFNSFPYFSDIFILYRFWVKVLCPKIFDVPWPSAFGFADKNPNIQLVIVPL